jgi:hypothetical protein
MWTEAPGLSGLGPIRSGSTGRWVLGRSVRVRRGVRGHLWQWVQSGNVGVWSNHHRPSTTDHRPRPPHSILSKPLNLLRITNYHTTYHTSITTPLTTLQLPHRDYHISTASALILSKPLNILRIASFPDSQGNNTTQCHKLPCTAASTEKRVAMGGNSGHVAASKEKRRTATL